MYTFIVFLLFELKKTLFSLNKNDQYWGGIIKSHKKTL